MRGLVFAPAVLVVLSWGGVAFAQSTAQSLSIPPGARQNAMGESGVALESDPADAMWWNPAALGFAEWFGVAYTRATLLPELDDLPYEHVAGAGRLSPKVGLGASVTALDYGAFDYGFGGIDASDWSGAIGVGYQATPELAVGVSGKYVSVDYGAGVLQGHTVGFDIGGLYRHTFAQTRVGIGLNVQNIGPEMHFEDSPETSPLSRNIKLGGAATRPIAIGSAGYDAQVTAVADWDHLLVGDKYDVLHFGAELSGGFRRWVRLAVRGGYYDDESGEITDWTWGVGGRVAGLSVDYGQIPQARNSGLPNVEKWTLGLHSDAAMQKLGAH